MSAQLKAANTMTLKKPKEEPINFRYVDKKGRYILQERIGERWRDVPFVGSETYVTARV